MSKEQHAAGVIGAAIAQRAVVCAQDETRDGVKEHAALIGEFLLDPVIDPHDEGKALQRADRAHTLLRVRAESKTYPPPSPTSSLQGQTVMLEGSVVSGDKWVPGDGAALMLNVLDEDFNEGLNGPARTALLETIAPIRRALGT